MRFTVLILIAFIFMHCKTKEASWEKYLVDGLPYSSFYPKEYKEGKQVPLILFLHGAGERGNDNESQRIHIAPILSDPIFQKENPCVLVFPQCPEEDYWAHVNTEGGQWTVKTSETPTPAMGKVIKVLDAYLQDPNIDKSRIYLSGLSMGGFGTFDLLSRKPELFAAAVPICGGADTSKVSNYTNVPLWNFHGAIDPVVPVELSQAFMSSFIEAGGNPRYTEYHDGEHNIWTRAYEEEELLPWLFQQKK